MNNHRSKRGTLTAALLVSAMALVAFTPPAQADVGGVSMGATNSIAANATTTANMGSGVNIENQEHIGCVLKMQGDRAGTGNITLTFARSHDNATWETTPRFTWITALNGNTAVVAYTNLTALTGAAGYLKLVSVANADASAAATNFSVTIVKKRVR